MRRRADLKAGYTCNSNCLFCVIGDKLFTGDRPTADCIDELRLSRETCEDVVFTGAEVTIRKDFLELVAAAKRLGYRTIQIQTNGRMFAYPAFCESAIRAGANEFSPSIHGHTAKIHDGLVRAPGSFDQIVQAIRNLKALGQRVVTNTVAAKQNQRHLPDLARLLVELKVDQFQIAFPHPTGHAATYFDAVVPRMGELAPYLHQALRIGIDAGVACMAEAMPYCQMGGLERWVSELYIPPTEIVYDGFVVPDYERDRVERGKTRFPQCASCRFEPICEGPWREYPEQVGSQEFQPVAGPRVLDGAIVLDRRFSMLGEPAPRFSLPSSQGDSLGLDAVRTPWIALAFYPEDGSPDCTAEVCSLQAGLEALRALGVSVIGVSPDPVSRHRSFATERGLSFPLLSDPDRKVAAAYGAQTRSTYLIAPDRRIAHVLVEPRVGDHAAQIASAIRRYLAPARSLERGPEQVRVRRPKSALELAPELGLDRADPSRFVE